MGVARLDKSPGWTTRGLAHIVGVRLQGLLALMDDNSSKLLALLHPALIPAVPGPRPEVREDALIGVGRLCVFDLEMSGPNPRVHEVLEVGAVIAGLRPGLVEEDAWGSRIRPRRIGNANSAALRIAGYSPGAWKKAPRVEEAMPHFFRLGQGALAAGWGVGQDLAFLREQLRREGRDWPFQPLVLDIQTLARLRLDRHAGVVERFNLGHVADRLGIGRMGEHSALADAYAAYDVLRKLVAGPPAGGWGETRSQA